MADAVVTCAVGTVEAGEDGTIEVTVQVDNGFAEGTELTDVASIDGDQIDGDTGNDDASFTSTVGAALNATVTVVADREVTTAGGPGGYEVMVTNEGPLTATGVQVEVTLPTELEELMADTSLVFAAGPQLAQVDIASCDVDGVLVTCEIGTLGVGETSSVTLSGTVASGTPDGTQLVASAAVTVAEPDTDPTDDTDRDIILVVSATAAANGATRAPVYRRRPRRTAHAQFGARRRRCRTACPRPRVEVTPRLIDEPTPRRRPSSSADL